MPTWYYFTRPSHTAFHDFTETKKPQKNLRSLLGLGLKFIPTQRYTHRWSSIRDHSFGKLVRNIKLRFYFAGLQDDDDNNDNDSTDAYNPKMHVASNWIPPPWTNPRKLLTDRTDLFESKMHEMFQKRRGKPNLLPHQRRALAHLQAQKTFLVGICDKNLGPAIIEVPTYVRMAFRDHLNDTSTYQRLTVDEAASHQARITREIRSWIDEHKEHLTKMEGRFLRHELNHNKNPFARFYLTLKAHKLKPGQGVRDLKSRPIVSCPGSLLAPLGTWIDKKLQEVAVKQPSYFRNSFDLLQELKDLDLPPNAVLFTADAVSMYTNIPTNQALNYIGQNLQRYRFGAGLENHLYPNAAVMDGLRLIMKNNIFTFGDMCFLQKNGTAMGTPPAPPYATLYMAIFERAFLQKHSDCLLFYKRFIDDVIGIYLPDPDPTVEQAKWNQLVQDLNVAPGLEWEFSPKSKQVNFMDLTLSIRNGRIVSTLYEKPLNLHLYIPPISAHPPGLMPGIVFGSLFRIYTLCNDEEDRQVRTRTFFRRLLARGYKSDKLLPLFKKAIERSRVYTGKDTGDNEKKHNNSVILHLPFHPNDPPSYKIQQAWRECVAEPQYKMPLCNMKNPKTRAKCGIDRMIIAYKRPMNLGNHLSCRDLTTIGPPVSSYFDPIRDE